MKNTRKNALISVSNKDGIVEFAQELTLLGWNIYSSGGTAKVMGAASVPVIDVAELTGFGAILDHRVVTLAPQVHGGLLAAEKHIKELEELGYPYFDLACIDFYPLEKEIQNPDSTAESVIETTDIGGPTMVRSAAKGRRIVVVDHDDRERVIVWLKEGQPDGEVFRNELAVTAEMIVAQYCLESARYHSDGSVEGVIGRKVSVCKYGENAQQTPAALYAVETDDLLALQNFTLVEGGAPSYNNWCDIDRLLQTITHIAAGCEKNEIDGTYIAVGAKHGNPCGASVLPSSSSRRDALVAMLSGDQLALFGGLVITNFPIGVEEAKVIREWNTSGGQKRLLDGIIAPSFCEEAKVELNRKEGKCRLLENLALLDLGISSLDSELRRRPVRGGFLTQPNYTFVLDFNDPDLEIVGSRCPKFTEIDLLLARAIGSTSNSNTITLVKDGKLIGNGVGQQDRVAAANLAIVRAERSGHSTAGAAAYSDSFFPFPDGVEVLIAAGVTAIFASKGSIRDDEIRDVCREAGITLYLIPDQIGRAFSDMDMAFYAGMGFDGYRLALQTERKVCFDSKSIDFDNQYRFSPSHELRNHLTSYDVSKSIPKRVYYDAYGEVLTKLYRIIDQILSNGNTGKTDEGMIERALAGCLLLLCGAHHGCTGHITQEEEFRAQMESMIIFSHTSNVISGEVSLRDSIPSSTELAA